MMTRYVRRGLALLLSLFGGSASVALAQGDGAVRGTVSRADGGAPIGGVTVNVRGTAIATVTSSEGTFVLPRVPIGQRVLRFRWIGYAPHEDTITVVAGQTITANVALRAQPALLNEVVVSTASRAPERITEAPAAISVIPPAIVNSIAPTGQAPLALATVPGVDVVQSGVNDFNVNARGFNSSLNRRVLVLLDGRDLATPFLQSQEWNTISAALDELGRIEVVRGPGSALYGANAFSGVVNITSPLAREVQGSKLTVAAGELSTFRLDFRNSSTHSDGRIGLKVNLGTSSSDTWSRGRTAIDSLDIVREYGPATDSTIRKAREVRPLNGQTLAASTLRALGRRDPLQTTYGSARADYYDASGAVGTVEGGIADARNEIAVTGIGRVQISRVQRPWLRTAWAAERFNLSAWYNGRKTVDPQFSLASGAPLDETSAITHLEGQYNNTFLGERGRFVLGASTRLTFLDTDASLVESFDDSRSDRLFSTYAQVEYRLTPQLKIVGAGRLDDGNLFKAQFSPKAALVFSPSTNHSFRATYNRAFQTPNYSEFFLRVAAGAPTASPAALERALEGFLATGRALGTAGLPATLPWNFDSLTRVFALGNRDLKVESITGYELGYKGNPTRNISFTVDLYYNDKKNFVTDLLPGVNPNYPRFSYTADGINILGYLDAIVARANALPLPAAQKAQILGGAAALRQNYNALVAGTTPTLATLSNGRRALVVSYVNAGRVTEQGVELGAGWQFTNTTRIDAAYSFFDFKVKEGSVGTDALLPNTPEHKGYAGISYFGSKGLDLGASLRFTSAFPWAAGVFAGFIPATQTVNVNAGYQLTNAIKGFITATNVLDQERFQLYGGSVNGRRVIAGLTTSF